MSTSVQFGPELGSKARPKLGPTLGLDRQDRKMLLILLSLVAVIVVVIALLTPPQDPNNNPVPDSYLSGQHGAKAAFTLLQQSGYTVTRWEEPLADLASQATGPDGHMVLILAEPFSLDPTDRIAVADILSKGGRVLATGFQGGALLPNNAVTFSNQLSFAACEAQPDGLSADLSPTHEAIWIAPGATWREKLPETLTEYTCAGQPIVVQYPVGKGRAIWWASSTPLENGSIARGANLELLLASIGPRTPGQHIYWDESLHGKSAARSPWDATTGPLWPLFWTGALGFMLLVILSYSRRSGPIRALPQAPRTTPIEFLDALGGLYRATGAASTALQIAWERFQTQTSRVVGLDARARAKSELTAQLLTAAIVRRFGTACQAMEADLIAAQDACDNPTLKPRQALKLIQTLRRHEEPCATSAPAAQTRRKCARHLRHSFWVAQMAYFVPMAFYKWFNSLPFLISRHPAGDRA